MYCQVCRYEAQHFRALAQHIKIHNHTTHSYYDKYLKKEGEDKCKECGAPTRYEDIRKGYISHCSSNCAQKNGDGGWNHQNAKERRKRFSEKMMGNTFSEGRPKGSKNKNPYPKTEAVLEKYRNCSNRLKGMVPPHIGIGWNHTEETKEKMSEIRSKSRKRGGGYFLQGQFKPLNPKKYEGDVRAIYYRSSWEMACMCKFDKDTNIVSWSSEEVVIPYYNPISKGIRRYFVDFKIKTADGRIILIEVKPSIQTKPPKQPKKTTPKFLEEAAKFGINQSKWSAAREYATIKGWEFQIWTEKELGLGSK